MTRVLFKPGTPVRSDSDLMRALLDCRISSEIRTLCLIGAHRFREKPFIEWVFPSIERFYLFEPLPELAAELNELAVADPRIMVFPFAISDTNSRCEFRVASNDGESSSLLDLGTHKDLFPNIKMDRTIEVTTRTLESVIDEHRLPLPDLMIVDVQGAEYQVLSALPASVLNHLRLIYTEVSTEQVYLGSQPLSAINALLSPRFVNVGFAPLTNRTPMHGNTVFVRKEEVESALALTAKGHVRRLVEQTKRLFAPRPAG